MRVIAGLYRHRLLVMPKNEVTRPTKDMVKEGLFSALGNMINNQVVLDLFAGSGSLGIEAISRGAKFCYFIDQDKEAIKTIKTNLTNLKINDAFVFHSTYQKALHFLNNKMVKIDVLILDPPYKMNDYDKLIDESNALLNEHAIIVIESASPINLKTNYQQKREYKYGDTFVTILWR